MRCQDLSGNAGARRGLSGQENVLFLIFQKSFLFQKNCVSGALKIQSCLFPRFFKSFIYFKLGVFFNQTNGVSGVLILRPIFWIQKLERANSSRRNFGNLLLNNFSRPFYHHVRFLLQVGDKRQYTYYFNFIVSKTIQKVNAKWHYCINNNNTVL